MVHVLQSVGLFLGVPLRLFLDRSLRLSVGTGNGTALPPRPFFLFLAGDTEWRSLDILFWGLPLSCLAAVSLGPSGTSGLSFTCGLEAV